MATHTLVVDSIACVGHGICADLFPEWIRLDSWGYPIINTESIPPELLVHARWAVANCPALALHLRSQRPVEEEPLPRARRAVGRLSERLHLRPRRPPAPEGDGTREASENVARMARRDQGRFPTTS